MPFYRIREILTKHPVKGPVVRKTACEVSCKDSSKSTEVRSDQRNHIAIDLGKNPNGYKTHEKRLHIHP